MANYVYAAGAMETYGDKSSEARLWRTRAKMYFDLHSYDFRIINPTDYYEIGANLHKEDLEVMRFDMRKVMNSSIILVNLKDLRKSVGTCDEILLAFLNNKPVIGFIEKNFESKEELKQYVHNWKYLQIDRIETGENALENACKYIIEYYG